MHPAQDSNPSRIRALSVTLAVAIFLLHAAYVGGAVVDDAYISFRYARHVAEGLGFVFNPGDPVEGYTNFSWVVLSALVTALGFEPAVVMPAGGVLIGAIVVGLVARAGHTLAREDGRAHPLAGLPAALALALNPSLAYYAASGLETALYTLLLFEGGIALVRRRPIAFALLTSFAFLTRPEAGLLGVVGVAAFSYWGTRGGVPVRRLFGLFGVFAAMVGPYLGFKLAYFGSVLPNTLAAKPPELAAGLAYTLDFLVLVPGFVVAALLDFRKARRRGLFLLWILSVGGVVLAGGDWMGFSRMLVPSLPWLLVAADRALLAAFRRPTSALHMPRLLALTLALAYVPLALLDSRSASELSETIEAYDDKRRAIAGELLRAGVKSVGTFDIGLIGYLLEDARMLDLGGLTDRTIAELPGAHYKKRIPSAYLAARAPDAFLLTSRLPPTLHPTRGIGIHGYYPAEDHVMGLRWFSTRYRYETTYAIRDEYFLNLFLRRPGSLPATAAFDGPGGPP